MAVELSYAHVYPLVRSGGLFLTIVGLGITGGGLLPRFRFVLLGISGAIAAVATIVFARQLTAPFGTPSTLQVWSLIAAVSLQVALIPVIVRRLARRGDRTLKLGILFVVGAHFILMAPAFGPLILALGLLAVLNAFVGLRLLPHVTLETLWIIDGALKVGIGALMLLNTPIFTV